MGYQIHLTETVTTQKQLSVVTDVTTRPTSTTDNQVLPLIQRKLVARELTPETHLTDAGYVDAPNLVQSREEFGIDLFGPASTDSSWQKNRPKDMIWRTLRSIGNNDKSFVLKTNCLLLGMTASQQGGNPSCRLKCLPASANLVRHVPFAPRQVYAPSFSSTNRI